MKKIFILITTLLASANSFAEVLKSDWMLKSGKLSYHVHFPIKNFTGTSENVKGKGQCDTKVCDFLVAVPVKSFDSGDGNRDNHMMETTRAALNPMVMVKIQIPKDAAQGEMKANAEVTFGGETHTYSNLKIVTTTKGNLTNAKGQIPLMLSHFHIERPSLLTVKIDDSVPVDFDLNWE